MKRKEVTPYEELSQRTKDEIAATVDLPRPPDRWKLLGHPDDPRPLAAIESRAFYEWYWARGRQPGDLRPTLPPRIRRAVIARDGLLCGLCGGDVSADDVHIDHIHPVAHGGTDAMENLQVAHSLCNIRKGARIGG